MSTPTTGGRSNSSTSSVDSGRVGARRSPPGPSSTVRPSIGEPKRRDSVQPHSSRTRGLPRRSRVASTLQSVAAMLFYEPDKRDKAILPHDPFKAVIAPRPIGWVSTLSPDGVVNLAPYSFFNAVGERPAMLAFSSTGFKDSAAAAGESGEFVWNLATWGLREAMNHTSAEVPRDVNEFEMAGLEMAPSRLVAPPRVAAAPCAIECRVVHRLELHDVDGAPTEQHLTIARG